MVFSRVRSCWSDAIRCHSLSFWRGFDRGALEGIGFLLLLLCQLELLRIVAFYLANVDVFKLLRPAAIMAQSFEAIPDDLVLTLEKGQGGELILHVNRELPFQLAAPRWCSTLCALLLPYKSAQ